MKMLWTLFYIYILPVEWRAYFQRPAFDQLIKYDNAIDFEIDGVDPRDYPDFCDAYICNAYWERLDEELDMYELDALNDHHADDLNEWAHESFY